MYIVHKRFWTRIVANVFLLSFFYITKNPKPMSNILGKLSIKKTSEPAKLLILLLLDKLYAHNYDQGFKFLINNQFVKNNTDTCLVENCDIFSMAQQVMNTFIFQCGIKNNTKCINTFTKLASKLFQTIGAAHTNQHFHKCTKGTFFSDPPPFPHPQSVQPKCWFYNQITLFIENIHKSFIILSCNS